MVDLTLYENDIKECLNEIKDYQNGDLYKNGFTVEESLPKHSILFLGVNPSCEKGTEGQWLKNPFYPINEQKLLSGKSKGYFEKSIEIATDCLNCHGQENYYAHHDIFPFRVTNQEQVKSLYREKSFSKCIKKCLDLSATIITEAEPLIIVAANAFIREVFFDPNYKFMGFEPATENNPANWNESIGADILMINGKKVPLVFTGMLGSTGVIDNGSFYALKWHIRHILNNKNLW